MEEIWTLLVIGYWVVLGITLLLTIISLVFLTYVFSIDEVSSDKKKIYDCVLELIEKDLEIKIKKPSIHFEYRNNDNLRGYYQQFDHSITLFMENLNVNSFLLTLVEEIHHSIFVSTSTTMKVYQLYDKKVGYDNNPLEYSAKVYARSKFKYIHRILKKRGLIKYKV